MKYLLLWSLLLFVTSCGSSQPPQAENVFEDKTLTPICELSKTPDFYNDKTIHAEAILYVARFGAFLYDVDCSNSERLISFNAQGDAVNEKLNFYLREPFNDGTKRLRVEVVGVFNNNKDWRSGQTSTNGYLFTITEVKEIKSDSTDIPPPSFKNYSPK